jgi:hypothetical protein
MPPVRVMGHVLPSRLPDKRSCRTYSKHSTNPEGGRSFSLDAHSGLPRQNIAIVGRVHGTHSCKQLSGTRSG